MTTTTPDDTTQEQTKPKPKQFSGRLEVDFSDYDGACNVEFTPKEAIFNGTRYTFPVPSIDFNDTDKIVDCFGTRFIKRFFAHALREHCLNKWQQVALTENPEELFKENFFDLETRGELTSLKLQQVANMVFKDAALAKREKRVEDYQRLMREYQSLILQQQKLMLEEMRKGVVVRDTDDDNEEES